MKYSPGLTGMRGLAAIFVILYHSIGVFKLPNPPIMISGNSGLVFFFVLSGYLLGSLYTSTGTRYFIKRAFRTFPLYYVTIPLYVVSGLAAIGITWAFYGALYPTPQWTLALEELFYFAILPVLFKLRNRLVMNWKYYFVAITALATILTFVWPSIQPSIPNIIQSTDTVYMPIFFVDYVIGFTLSGIRLDGQRNTIFTVIVVTVWAIVILNPNPLLTNSPTFALVYGLVYGGVIITMANNIIFTNKLSESLGKWSYSIYLIHLPFLTLFGWAGIPLTIFFSALIYRAFETKMVAVGDRLLEYIGSRRIEGDVL